MAISPVPVTASSIPSWIRAAATVINNLQQAVGTVTRRAVRTVATDYTFVSADYLVLIDATAGAVTVTLPAVVVGKQIAVKRIDGSANVVTIAGPVNGVTSQTLAAQWAGLSLIGATSGWITQ
jgi:hypothetical protein